MEEAAAIRYHGKTKPPRPTHHMVEFEAVVERSDTGTIPPSKYRLENVAGKLASAGQDVLAYRIVFVDGYSVSLKTVGMHVSIAPAGQKGRRRGRPEVGFSIHPMANIGGDGRRNDFVHSVAYDLVFDPAVTDSIRAIYFELEDCDVTPLPPNAWRDAPGMSHALTSGGPLWRLGIDTSSILKGVATVFKTHAKWFSLSPLHPDPAVDPGVPIQDRPQRKPRWYWYRSQGPAQLGGQLSGTKWYKLLGKFPKDGIKGKPFNGNPATRSGRMMESPVCLSYLASSHHKEGTVLYECGSFPHPTIPDVMASPDAIIHVPDKAKYLPQWFKALFTESEFAAIDFTRGVWECKTMMTKDSKGQGPLFKEEFFPQLYAEMICAGVHWAELVRYCAETGEMRLFKVYRKPDVSRQFDATVKRMRAELISGVPFEACCDHPTNVQLLRECARTASFFNTAPAKGVKLPYRVIPWSAHLVAEFENQCALFDSVSRSPDEKGPTIQEMNLPKVQPPPPPPPPPPSGKKRRGGGGGGKKKRDRQDGGGKEKEEEEDEELVARTGGGGGGDQYTTAASIWLEIEHQTKRIKHALTHGGVAKMLDDRLLQRQMLLYGDLSNDLSVSRYVADSAVGGPIEPVIFAPPPPPPPPPLPPGNEDEEEEEEET